MQAILIGYDHAKSGFWALPVDRKGAQEETVEWIVGRLDEAGYAGVPVIIKSDQEPAMIALKKAISIRRESRDAVH